MRVSAVLVHYHAADLLARAVDSLRREARSLQAAAQSAVAAVPAGEPPPVEMEILVVDNGADAAQRERLHALPCRLIEPGRNLGYAGGLNRGVEEASGDVLLLANPDLELRPGSLARLLATTEEARRSHGAAVVGPAFHWDSGGRFLLPPAERRDRSSELAARLADRGPRWAEWARRGWRRHARRHWRATEALGSSQLSGALLVATRSAWERLGPFDDGFQLYFEETDWLRRAPGRGVAVLYEPRAAVLHHYNRSAALEPRAAAWFQASEERFARRWYGAAFRGLLGLAAPASCRLSFPPRPEVPGRPVLDLADLGLSPAKAQASELWVELSPSPRGFPATAERLPAGARRWELPPELWRRLDAATWRLALVDERGQELVQTAVASL